MSSSHIKRLMMPRSWPLPRKTSIWVQKPNPSGHSIENCMPLTLILRDVLAIAHTKREAKKILHSRKILVDGRKENDSARGVGLMEVLTIDGINYRCILDTNGKLRYRIISEKSAKSKICMVTGKTTIKGGVTQLHLHDGRNILLDSTSQYNTGDSIVISLPEQKILTHLPMEKDSLAYLIGGNHIGETAKITDFSIKRSSKPNETSFEDFLTVSEYVFIIGNESDLPLEDE